MPAASTLSRETLLLRFAGMILLVSGAGGLMYLEDAGDPLLALRSNDTALVARTVIGWLAAANAAALGLILLLTGLRQLSPRRNARVRHGIAVKWIAANLLLIILAAVMLEDAGAVDLEQIPWYLLFALIPVFVLLSRSSFRLLRSGWKYDASSAQDAVSRDPRPPVLYLRSFGADSQILVGEEGRFSIATFFNYTATLSPEQELALILGQLGPVVAIGRPGERLPELGAARRYVSDDEWRDVVTTWMSEAALVVFRAGETESVWWEIEQALTRCPRQRVVIVQLGAPESLASFQRRFDATFGAPVEHPAPRLSWPDTVLTRLFLWTRVSPGRVIYFDHAGAPQAVPMLLHFTWHGFVQAPYRPYRDPLRTTFRAVFAQLGLPWTVRKSQAIAILLALFGGLLWLHEFYVGRRRRALKYLASFYLAVPIAHLVITWLDVTQLRIVPLIVPIGLGWIAAARFALLDETQFRATLANAGTARSRSRAATTSSTS